MFDPASVGDASLRRFSWGKTYLEQQSLLILILLFLEELVYKHVSYCALQLEELGRSAQRQVGPVLQDVRWAFSR